MKIISNVSNYSKNADYNTKISESESRTAADHDHDKYITTQESNEFKYETFTARLE